MKHYLIYEIKNKLNGMVYVGKHMTDNINDSYMGSGIRIQRAIEKYGIENFEKSILFKCASEEEMNAKEAEIVNEDFIARDDVYNISLGGYGSWKHVKSCGASTGGKNSIQKDLEKGINRFAEFYKSLTQEQREQYINDHPVSKSFYCDWKGRKHSEETKKKMSEKAKLRRGQKNSMFGKMWICNDATHESKSILKTDEIPNGWRKGRFCK